MNEQLADYYFEVNVSYKDSPVYPTTYAPIFNYSVKDGILILLYTDESPSHAAYIVLADNVREYRVRRIDTVEPK